MANEVIIEPTEIVWGDLGDPPEPRGTLGDPENRGYQNGYGPGQSAGPTPSLSTDPSPRVTLPPGSTLRTSPSASMKATKSLQRTATYVAVSCTAGGTLAMPFAAHPIGTAVAATAAICAIGFGVIAYELGEFYGSMQEGQASGTRCAESEMHSIRALPPSEGGDR